jgi:hypothetical protein
MGLRARSCHASELGALTSDRIASRRDSPGNRRISADCPVPHTSAAASPARFGKLRYLPGVSHSTHPAPPKPSWPRLKQGLSARCARLPDHDAE